MFVDHLLPLCGGVDWEEMAWLVYMSCDVELVDAGECGHGAKQHHTTDGVHRYSLGSGASDRSPIHDLKRSKWSSWDSRNGVA